MHEDVLVYDTFIFSTLAYMQARRINAQTASSSPSEPEDLAMTFHRTRAITQLQLKIQKGAFDDVLLQCVMSMILADVRSNIVTKRG